MAKKTCYNLNKDWFIISGNGMEEVDFHRTGIPTENAVKAELPCFTHMYIEDHLGLSWYEKNFLLEELSRDGELALLCFEQADFRTEVSVNGRIVGEHIGGEDPFYFDVTGALQKGQNRLTVRVSKPYEKDLDGYTFDEIPHRNQKIKGLVPGACYNESGICGAVELKWVPKCYIDDLYLDADAKTGDIRVKLEIINTWGAQNSETKDKWDAQNGNEVTGEWGPQIGNGAASDEEDAYHKCEIRLNVRKAPGGEVLDSCADCFELKPGKNEITMQLKVEEFELWELESPILYEVNACLCCNGKEHNRGGRTGFRTFEVQENGYFYLNGKRIFLKCSHTGNCMPLSTHHISRDKELLRKDFLMAKAVGFNMIRFISGAALPLQLDLCDEIGLMIYEEPCSSWNEKNGPHATALYSHDLLTMVKRDRNHPCVTIWGLLNETFLKPPYDEVCMEAQNSLPKLRELDQSRLVLFSSGRWDAQQAVGSVCNPYHEEWQTLWNGEGSNVPVPDEDAKYFHGACGDIHHYTHDQPYAEEAVAVLGGWGKFYKRPVFVSESGTGSVLDTISLVNRIAQDESEGLYPDVKMIRQMNDIFHAELQKYGFDRLFPLPSELMRGSMENHAKYRTQAFDILRSNPYVNGLSLTGLLDHSICGEGLWTLYREYKPMIADVLQDGFSKLRWCITSERWSVYRGENWKAKVSLANEDILKINKAYPVRCTVSRKGRTYRVEEQEFVMNEQQAQGMAVPVREECIATEQLEEGTYTFKAELSGACASGGIKTFHVFEHVNSKTGRSICAVGLTDDQMEWLKERGYKVCKPEELDAAMPVDGATSENGATPEKGATPVDGAAPENGTAPGNMAVLAGTVTEEALPILRDLLAKGASVIAAEIAPDCNQAFKLLPESRRPGFDNGLYGDWLYHKEYVLSPESPFFDGIDPGVMEVELYQGVFNPCVLSAEGAQVPDDTHAIAFNTGEPCESGYTGGFCVGTYRVGAGCLTLNTFHLLDAVRKAPMAERILVNMLDEI